MGKYESPYLALGSDGIKALVDHFYDLMDNAPKYKALREMHAVDLSSVRGKLTDYLIGWMGGPQIYLEKYGSVCMTGPHESFRIGTKERDLWVACMYESMESMDVDDEVQLMLRKPLARLADAVRNTH
ncbi:MULTISPECIES: group II truncated hemoglobin [Marinomonas]|uniref:Hemoglobin n=3 Tax=Marinomonas TaxID=28253 RepID=A0A1M5MYM0_9GAMM|nr:MULTISPECIES: group II truncated hemoglobin [Marinomonas]MBR7889851.1 group II truncated hemoglobin [Marinomonas vulgaris]RCW98308.1 hemoglobin [Marinomonas foliarum]SHG82436.1 hemoglobin [Marinomonas polaris DSM 16579]